MRKLLVVVTAIVVAGLSQGSAEAGLFDGLIRRSEPQQVQYYQAADGQWYYTGQTQQVQPYYVEEQRPNAFQQLWEMEQRKNAWLKRTFFGY